MTILKTKPYNSTTAKKEQVATMFNNIARRYDFFNKLLSSGIDKRWRKKAIKILKPKHPKQILDIATGTADFAIMAQKLLKPDKITGIDISDGMLNVGRKKLKKLKLNTKIELLNDDSENMKFEDNTFDAITVGFGVRNFDDLQAGLNEMYRVLKPGGTLIILELSKPKVFPIKQFYSLYFNYLVPFSGKILSKDKNAYTYLPKSVYAFPESNEFLNMIKKTGFPNPNQKPLTFGVVSIYYAVK